MAQGAQAPAAESVGSTILDLVPTHNEVVV